MKKIDKIFLHIIKPKINFYKDFFLLKNLLFKIQIENSIK